MHLSLHPPLPLDTQQDAWIARFLCFDSFDSFAKPCHRQDQQHFARRTGGRSLSKAHGRSTAHAPGWWVAAQPPELQLIHFSRASPDLIRLSELFRDAIFYNFFFEIIMHKHPEIIHQIFKDPRIPEVGHGEVILGPGVMARMGPSGVPLRHCSWASHSDNGLWHGLLDRSW